MSTATVPHEETPPALGSPLPTKGTGREPLKIYQLEFMQHVQTPRLAHWFARLLLLLFVVSPIVVMFVPWQQSIYGTGRMIAYDPTERQQEVEAPVDGRVIKWHVLEGQKVKGPVYDENGKMIRPGDALVSIQDPDPDLPMRLQQQRTAVLERISAARDRITSFTMQIKSLESSQRQAIIAAENRLRMSDERLKAAKEALAIAKLRSELESTNYRMEKDLIRDGLTSQLAYIAAQQRKEQAVAEERRAVNSKDASVSEVDAIRADMEKIRADTSAAISAATASRQSAEAELASATRDIADIDIRIARQSTQEVTAPCDGTIYRILCNSARGGSLVKAGSKLLIITPEISEASKYNVELYIDGNDAPQLTESWRRRILDGENVDLQVRVQFEGWPAIQIIGWPTLAWGTFSGKVVLIDPHDDGKGRFRVLVQPDDPDNPWPSAFSLRQGCRAQGWVLLDQVSLGYELWRRFNGFPTVVAEKDKDKDDDDEGDKKKPGKVKVPK